MDFYEIRDLFESRLSAELGAEHPFRVTTTEEWAGLCSEPPHQQHLEDMPRACFDCHRIHVPEWEYTDFTDARVAASVEMIMEQLEAE